MEQIDTQMIALGHDWHEGDARRAWEKYPALREDVRSARAIAIRESGADKVTSIRKYVEAQDAIKVDADGQVAPDHDIRIKASDRVLRLLGENPVGASGPAVTIAGSDNKIVIVTSGGRPAEDMI